MIDYALWEVIENRNTAPKTTVMEGVEKVMPPTTVEEKAQKRLEDAKLLMKAIEKRLVGMHLQRRPAVGAFGRNDFTRRCEPEAIKKFFT
ncbi:hypothetical protein Tco_1462647 [Tanacetum coccineum]